MSDLPVRELVSFLQQCFCQVAEAKASPTLIIMQCTKGLIWNSLFVNRGVQASSTAFQRSFRWCQLYSWDFVGFSRPTSLHRNSRSIRSCCPHLRSLKMIVVTKTEVRRKFAYPNSKYCQKCQKETARGRIRTFVPGMYCCRLYTPACVSYNSPIGREADLCNKQTSCVINHYTTWAFINGVSSILVQMGWRKAYAASLHSLLVLVRPVKTSFFVTV